MRFRLPVRLRGRGPALWLMLGAVAVTATAVTSMAYADRKPSAMVTSATTPVRRGVVELTASAAGAVQAVQSRGLSFSTGGVVTEVDVKAGDQVTAGQVLARMDGTSVQDEVNSAQANVNSATDALTRAQQTTPPPTSTCQAAPVAYVSPATAPVAYVSPATAPVAYVSPAAVSPSASAPTSPTPSASAPASPTPSASAPASASPTPSASASASASRPATASVAYVSPAAVSPSASASAPASPTPSASASASPSRPAQPSSKPSQPSQPGGGGSTGGRTGTGTGSCGGGTSGGSAGGGSGGSTSGRSGSGDSLMSAEQQLTNAQLALRLAQEKLAGTTITAPVAGKVLSVAGTAGAEQTPGASGFIVLGGVADTAVRAGFSEADVARLAVGQTTTITLPNRNGAQVKGKVSQIDPAGTTSGRLVRYSVLVAFDQVPTDLLLGQSANVAVVTASASNVLYVPSTAVRSANGGTTVTVRSGGRDKSRTVQVGLRGDQYTEIRSGLQEGDEVVV